MKSELTISNGYYDSDNLEKERNKNPVKYQRVHDRTEKMLNNSQFATYTKNQIKKFEKYADRIEKLSYIRCKESLLDFITNRSIVRTTIIDKARDPFERIKKKKTAKLTLIEREKEEVKKPTTLYAKTGEIRLREVSPDKLVNKSSRMKKYGRWYLKPDQWKLLPEP